VLALVLLAVCATGVASAQRRLVEPVSPGAVDAFAPVEHRCPTFSWTQRSLDVAYELVVYDVEDLPEPDSEGSEHPRLRVTLPAGTSSWTPPAQSCFERGGRYVWLVEELGGELSDEERRRWSEPRLFEVREQDPDVAALVERLERRLAEVEELAQGGAAAAQKGTGGMDPKGAARSGGGGTRAAAGGCVPVAAVAGVRSLRTAASGEEYGVHGGTASEDAPAAGVLGEATAATGEAAGGRFVAHSPDAAAVRLESLQDGALLIGLDGAVETLRLDADGTVSGNAFLLTCSTPLAVFRDADQDGFGGSISGNACQTPAGFATTGGDCDDGEPAVNPAAPEICDDGVDNDCDMGLDIGDSECFPDADMDGYQSSICGPGFDDCNDDDPDVYPGALEICNAIDDDCNIQVDDDCTPP
jgi:hypothetical protein